MDVASPRLKPSTNTVSRHRPGPRAGAGANPEPAPIADGDGVSLVDHVARVLIWMAITAGVLLWTLRHSEAQLRDGLRSIELAQRIDAGSWREALVNGIDHPLHPLGIVVMHRLIGGEGPEWWQRAAVALSPETPFSAAAPCSTSARALVGVPSRLRSAANQVRPSASCPRASQ